MRSWRRLRWAIGMGGLKLLAVTIIFVYSKHKAGAPAAPVHASTDERAAVRISGHGVAGRGGEKGRTMPIPERPR